MNKAKAAENAAVGAYVDFYLADGTISSVLETVPYVQPRRRGPRRDPHGLGGAAK